MRDFFQKKVTTILKGKLSEGELERLSHLFKQLPSGAVDHDEHSFFRPLAYELTWEIKKLAQLIVDFRKDMDSKVHPDLEVLATKYLPQTSDQLEAVIEATECAANKIMDNLEAMQENTARMRRVFISLRDGKARVPLGDKGSKEVKLEEETLAEIWPLISYVESVTRDLIASISDSFVQMSFQDLTGQRIKRVMDLVAQVDARLKKIVLHLGIKLNEKGKNPSLTKEELDRVVEEKVTALAGPKRPGEGLSQSDIDQILAGK